MRIIEWDADEGGILEIEKQSSTSSVFNAYNQATDFCTHQSALRESCATSAGGGESRISGN